MRTWALLAAGWARRPHHHLHSGPLPPTPAHSDTSYTLKCEEPDNLSAKTKPIRVPTTYPRTHAGTRNHGLVPISANRR